MGLLDKQVSRKNTLRAACTSTTIADLDALCASLADRSGPSAEPETVSAAAVVSAVAPPPGEPSLPSGTPSALASQPQPAYKSSMMGPVVRAFEDAIVQSSAEGSSACALQTASFIDGVEAFAGVLDKMGGSMGSYLMA